MSWLFSQALVEEYSHLSLSGTELFVPSKKTPMHKVFWYSDKTMDVSIHSRYGMMPRLLTERDGKDLLNSFQRDSLASLFRRQALQERRPMTFGGWPSVSSPPFLQISCFSKMFPRRLSPDQSKRFMGWVSVPSECRCQRKTWAVTTYGTDTGYLHTPTTIPNYTQPSMLRMWPSCREYAKVFGKPSITIHEWMMGLPIGWSDIERSAMPKYRQWRRSLM